MKLFACLGTCSLALALVATIDAGELDTSAVRAKGFWGTLHAHHTGCCETSIGCGRRHEHMLMDKHCACRKKSKCGCRKRSSRSRCATGNCGNRVAHSPCASGNCGNRVAHGGCASGNCGKANCGCRKRQARVRRHPKSCECSSCCVPPTHELKLARRSPRAAMTWTPTSGLSETGIPRICVTKIEGLRKCRTTRGCDRGCQRGCTLCLLGLHGLFPCNKDKCKSGGCNSQSVSCACGSHGEGEVHEIHEVHESPKTAPTPMPMKDPAPKVPKPPMKKPSKRSV